MSKILVVDDETSYLEALQVGLGQEGYEVVTCADGRQALALFDRDTPDLVLLDLMLPGMSGFDVCRELRQRSQVPVVIVSAKDAEADIVLGLELGADDYITKPYSVRELTARIRAALRRAPLRPHKTAAFEFMGVRLDLDRYELTALGVTHALPRKEFELLAVLMEEAGKVVPRDDLMDRIWGLDYVGNTKTLDVHVKRLRAKIEPDPANPVRITTVRGVGYRFEDRVPAQAQSGPATA